MTLGQKQRKFMKMTSLLLAFVNTLPGHELTAGRGHVPGAKVKSGKPSCHALKLAHDWNLFINGVYQKKTSAHAALGKFWKERGGSWGGDFVDNPDGNHYSLKHGGVR